MVEQAAGNYGKRTGTGKGCPPVAMRFKTGNAGRPKGSRNRSSVFAEALSDGDAIAIVEASARQKRA
jgi:hypothetical protein